MKKLHTGKVLLIVMVFLMTGICIYQKFERQRKIDRAVNNVEETEYSWLDEQTMKENHFSTLQCMLEIGDTGTFQALNKDASHFETENITIYALYMGAEAVSIIKKYCNTDECPYTYENPPEGTSWHVIEYTIDRAPEDLYADIRVFGLDEKRLADADSSYTTRTHDIYSDMKKEETRYTGLYCYYAVPDDCSEYVLRVGDKLSGVDSDLAYYHIKY